MAERKVELVLSAQNRTDKAFKKVDKNISQLEKHAGKVKALGNVFAVVTAGAVAATLAMNQLSDSLVTTLTDLDNIGKTSRRLGLTTDELQDMREVAKATGVEVSAFDTAFQRFARRTGQARLGTGELVKTFDYLGIQLKDNQGNLKTNADLFKEFGEKVSAVSDENIQLALTMSGVDTEGVKLIEMFRTTQTEQQKIIDQAKEYGGLYDESIINGAETYLQEIQQIREAQDRISSQVLTNFSPMVLEWEKLKLAITKASGALVKFAAENIESITSFGSAATAVFLKIVPNFSLLTSILGSLSEKTEEVTEKTQELNQSTDELVTTTENLDLAEKELQKTREEEEKTLAKKQKSVDDILSSMEEESRLLKLSTKEQYIYNQVKKGGEDLTYDQVDAIKESAAALFDEKEALKENKRQTDELNKSKEKLSKNSRSIAQETQKSSSSTSAFAKEEKDVDELEEKMNGFVKSQADMLGGFSNKPIEHNVKSVQEYMGSPIDLTPEKAKENAREIKQVMQAEFDTDPVKIRIVTESPAGQKTGNKNSITYDDVKSNPRNSRGNWGDNILSNEALKTGGKQ